MIDREDYESCLRLFNGRDYPGVLSWFAPQFEIPQFIHYHLEGGKFKRALCALAA